jgi:ABC-type transport system involved in multi-copper enzyme maturation permease subunit
MPTVRSPEATAARGTGRRQQLAAIVRFTLLEAVRSPLPWLLAAATVGALAAAGFAASLALTEGARFQAALFGSGVRIAWVFIFAVYVIGSIAREMNERGFEVALALEVDRSTWVLGKLAGLLLPVFLATLLSWPLLVLVATPAGATAWCVSLAAELTVVVAAALFFSLSLGSVPAAAVLTAGFYLLARTMDSLLLIASASPLLSPGAWRDFAELALSAAAWLLPALGRLGQGSWLADQPPEAITLAAAALQCLVYAALLCSAALVDFHRRDL